MAIHHITSDDVKTITSYWTSRIRTINEKLSIVKTHTTYRDRCIRSVYEIVPILVQPATISELSTSFSSCFLSHTNLTVEFINEYKHVIKDNTVDDVSGWADVLLISSRRFVQVVVWMVGSPYLTPECNYQKTFQNLCYANVTNCLSIPFGY